MEDGTTWKTKSPRSNDELKSKTINVARSATQPKRETAPTAKWIKERRQVKTEMTVEDALKDLRELLGPKAIFELQIACDMFGNTHYRLVSYTTALTGITSSLRECVAQVQFSQGVKEIHEVARHTPRSCTWLWTPEDNSGFWTAQCKEDWPIQMLHEGAKFCAFCGRNLVVEAGQ